MHEDDKHVYGRAVTQMVEYNSRGPTRPEKTYEISKSLDFSDFYSDFKLISK